MQKFFWLVLPLVLLTLGGCASQRPQPVEVDDVYVVEADRQADADNLRAQMEAGPGDSLNVNNRTQRERREINPRLLRALAWTGGIILQFGIDILLVLLLYS